MRKMFSTGSSSFKNSKSGLNRMGRFLRAQRSKGNLNVSLSDIRKFVGRAGEIGAEGKIGSAFSRKELNKASIRMSREKEKGINNVTAATAKKIQKFISGK